jgi:cyclopropane fatty-acyl-phospholipid synthase-like methyltransferase
MLPENTSKKPNDFDYWVSRWDWVQEYFNPDRKERFAALISLIKAKCGQPKLILDLGCGTGSMMLECLKAFPSTHVMGVDIDFTLLELAKGRLEHFSPRFTVVQTDFRKPDWQNLLPGKFDAVVSATALHWLAKEQLAALYSHVHQLLNENGLFLNADHVRSSDDSIQVNWKTQKAHLIFKNPELKDPWESFWDDYLNVLGNVVKLKRAEAIGNWNGIEDGLPLEWHFENLKKAGFKQVDCFYRFFGDAIYGGIKA